MNNFYYGRFSFLNKYFGRIKLRPIFLCLFLLAFSSCSKRGDSRLSIFSLGSEKKKEINTFLLNEAKNQDIPVPINFSLQQDLCSRCDDNSEDGANQKKLVSKTLNVSSDYSNMLVYSGKSDLNSVLNFYSTALEFSGWQVKNFSNEKEGMFICSKPRKQMVVSIRSKQLAAHKKNLEIYFFIEKLLLNLDSSSDIKIDFNKVNSKELVTDNLDFDYKYNYVQPLSL